MKRKITTLLFLLGMTFATLSVSGCDSTLQTYVTTTYPQAIRERASANISIAEKLYNDGYITQDTYSSIVTQINTARDNILSGVTDAAEDASEITNSNAASEDEEVTRTDAIGQFSKYTSRVMLYSKCEISCVEYVDTNNVLKTDKSIDSYKMLDQASKDNYENLSAYLLGNYIYGTQTNPNHSANSEGEADDGTKYKTKEWLDTGFKDTANDGSVDFFTTGTSGTEEALENKLNDMFKTEIYVLDPTTFTDDDTLDSVLAEIYNAATGTDDEAKKKASRFFTSTGQLLADSETDGEIIKVVKVSQPQDGDLNTAYINEPGYDLVLYQSIYYGENATTKTNMPVAQLRFNEFNQKSIDALYALVKDNSGTYMFANDGDDFKACLLEYPVSIIDTFSQRVNGSNTIVGKLTTESGIGVNIGNGNLIYYDKDSSGNYLSTGKVVKNYDGYLTTPFGADSSSVNISSFVILGYTKYTYKKSDDSEFTTYIPQIVLRDYLEATWSPGIISGETLVVYGRKIRFKMDTDDFKILSKETEVEGKIYIEYNIKYSTGGEPCAYFVDMDGNTVSSTSSLYIYDICDIESLGDLTDASAIDSGYAYYGDSTNWDNKASVANSLEHLKTLSSASVSAVFNTMTKTWFKRSLGNTFYSAVEYYSTSSSAGTTFGDVPIWDNILKIYTDRLSELGGSLSDADMDKKWNRYAVVHFPQAAIEPQDVVKECTADDTDTQPEQSELLECTNITEIKASAIFPGSYIGSIDVNNTGSNIEKLYCVTTTKGLFDSALYSSWINSTTSKESLKWWNSYLAEKGYKYTIDLDGLDDYLQTNYAYELSQNGAIILDLETVAKIQEIFDKDSDAETASKLKTLFIVIGILLVAYSMALMLCWIVDTHIDLGFSLLNKATFGHWIAITSEDDMPAHKTGEHTYVTGGKMFIRCLIIVAAAVVLMRVNILKIASLLITTFGKIGGYAEGIIRGN
jgi:hypothetical protein